MWKTPWCPIYEWWIFHIYVTGWWYTYPSEKYESQLGLLFSIYGKIKNVPNHQPGHIVYWRVSTLW